VKHRTGNPTTISTQVLRRSEDRSSAAEGDCRMSMETMRSTDTVIMIAIQINCEFDVTRAEYLRYFYLFVVISKYYTTIVPAVQEKSPGVHHYRPKR
jgi:hypothetical protein